MYKFIYGALVVVILLVAKGFNSFAAVAQNDTGTVIALTDATANAGAIDIYIDHKLVLGNFTSSDPTVYIPVAAGDHLVDVVPAGGTVVLMKTSELTFETGHSYQLFLMGSGTETSMQVLDMNEDIN